MFFFFNDTATTEIYTLSLHDALPISSAGHPAFAESQRSLRPVRIREDRRGQCDARRRYGPDTDCSDDPDFPGLGARDHFGLDLDPSLLPGRIPFVECLRRDHQYHGAGRTRLGALATDRDRK